MPGYDIGHDPLLASLPSEDEGVHIGNCVLLEKIGQGGMGAVYLGRHLNLDVPVAVKVLPFDVADSSPDALARFKREAQSAARIDHPHLIRVFNVAQQFGVAYMVMEFIDGESVNARLEREGPFPEAHAIEIAISAARGLAAAHTEGIIHRDIKPANILIRHKDGRVKVADLGLAKSFRRRDREPIEGTEVTGHVTGTPAFMSPEQALGEQNLDGRTDIYSLGATLFTMLTGQRVFNASTPTGVLQKVANVEVPDIREVRPDTSVMVATAIREMMIRDRPQRLQTMLAVLKILVEARVRLRRMTGTIVTNASLARRRFAGKVRPVASRSLDDVTREELQTAALADREREGLASESDFGTTHVQYLRRVGSRTRALTAAAVLLVVGAACAWWFGYEQPRSRRHRQAIRLMVTAGKSLASGKLDAARTALNDAARKEPKLPGLVRLRSDIETQFQVRHLLDEAKTLVGTGALTRAQAKLFAALELDPENAEAKEASDALDRKLVAMRSETGPSAESNRRKDRTPPRQPDTGLAQEIGKEAYAELVSGAVEFMKVGKFRKAGALLVPALRLAPDGVKAVRLLAALKKIPPRTIMEGHTRAVTCAAFSPDGRKVATSSSDNTARIWNATSGEELAVLKGHEKRVACASFSPGGSTVLTASSDGTARIWDAGTGKIRCLLRGHLGTVYAAAFSLDGSRVVTASADKTARIWNAATGQCRLVIRRHSGRVYSAVFSPDGSRILTASGDGAACISNAETGKMIRELRGPGGAVVSAVFSPDGLKVAAATKGETARIWDAETGEVVGVLKGHGKQVTSVAFSSDGSRIVTGSTDNTARVWDVDSGQVLYLLKGHASAVYSAAFSPDDDRIITASGDRSGRIWMLPTSNELLEYAGRLASGEEVPRLRRPAARPAARASAPEPGKTVAEKPRVKPARKKDPRKEYDGLVATAEAHIASGEYAQAAALLKNALRLVPRGVRARQLLTSRLPFSCLTVLTGHHGPVNSAAFSPDGSKIVTASGDGTAGIWDVATGRQVLAFKGHAGWVLSAAFSRDGKLVATASNDRTARVWDATTGEEVLKLTGYAGDVSSAAFSPDGTKVVTASGDGITRVWRVNTGRIVVTFKQHVATCAEFSPGGKNVLTASPNRHAYIWDLAGGAQLVNFTGHTATLHSAAFSADGSKVVTASRDRTARIWDAVGGRELLILRGHTGWVYSAAFSHNAARVVTGSDDGTARVWDAATGKVLAVLREHTRSVRSASFSLDGSRIVTASWDGTARVWGKPMLAELLKKK